MFAVFAVAILLVMVSFVLLGINIFLFKRKFPETDVGKNKDMIRLGLKCPRCEELNQPKPAIRITSIKVKSLRPDWNGLDK